jgi:hypothetical protein
MMPAMTAYRDPIEAPLRKLSVDLIKTYKHINEVKSSFFMLIQSYICYINIIQYPPFPFFFLRSAWWWWWWWWWYTSARIRNAKKWKKDGGEHKTKMILTMISFYVRFFLSLSLSLSLSLCMYKCVCLIVMVECVVFRVIGIYIKKKIYDVIQWPWASMKCIKNYQKRISADMYIFYSSDLIHFFLVYLIWYPLNRYY